LEQNDTTPAAPEGAVPASAAPVERPTVADASLRRRPRGRTTLIIAAATLLGVAGGAAVGYGIQAERAPTPLAALSQPGLGYPAKSRSSGPAPLPVAEDRRVRTDGDLRKLLVDRPEGARETPTGELGLGDGWEPIDQYAESHYKDPHHMFETLIGQGLRRVASVSWEEGKHRETDVRLLQFRSGDLLGAAEHLDSRLTYMPRRRNGAGNEGDAIKGSGQGRYFLYPAQREAGYLPSYRARALAMRGDIVLDINIFDSAPISKKDIRTLAERQLERL
jgi:hypothetical protein